MSVLSTKAFRLFAKIYMISRGRPRKIRRIQFQPQIRFFKPSGIPLRELEIVRLTPEEIEALRLVHDKKFTQIKAAKQMKISQSTLHRTLEIAYQKITQAMMRGNAIRIEGDPFEQ